MRKPIILLFSIIILISSLSIGASAAYNKELNVESNIVYMESIDNGTVIFNKNSKKKTAPASLTKIITAMVVLEKCDNFNEVITVPQHIIRSFDGMNSSNAGINVGERLTVDQLLNLMLVKSANEAASILAYHFGGNDIDNFVSMMNDHVKKLGCTHTHFMNPHGLDEDDHYTTAEDLAIIVKNALKNKKFVEITSTLTYHLAPTNKRPEGKSLNTTNFLISPHSKKYYYKYAKGIKTGTTENAGHCLISTASKNGYTYLLIDMGAPERDIDGSGPKNFAFLDSETAYEWAFNNIKLKVVADPADVVTDIDVDLSKDVDHVRLVPKEEVSALVPSKVHSSGILIEPIKESLPNSVQAPIKKGDKIGKARVMYAGEKICEIDIVAGENVKRSLTKYIGYLFKKVFKSTTAKIIGIVALLLLIFYITVNILYHRKKKKRKIYVVDNYRNMRR